MKEFFQNSSGKTEDTLGVLGLPAPLSELKSRSWDAILVGAGHNGLACAAYLALAGLNVLVLEKSERVGGACTLEEPWPGCRVSPCAYLCGLLHPLLVNELKMKEHGFIWIPTDSGLFVPFEDGSYVQLWNDETRCEVEIKRVAPGDLEGWRAMKGVIDRTREALRPPNAEDMWIGPAPQRQHIEERLKGDPESIGLLFEWSMAEFLERYLDEECLHLALLGQGVIGTNASPFEKGTASVHFHHSSGRMDGRVGQWGYVKGGMGMVSFILCDIAREAGAVVASGVPVARILPGEGVELEGEDRIEAPIIVSNADPRSTLRLLGGEAESGWRARVERIPLEGCTVKLSVLLRELPDFLARPGRKETHHLGQINTPLSKVQWRDNCPMARKGQLPPRMWTELYFQTAIDPGTAPPGMHLMSVFAQYVPYEFEKGDWDSRRGEVNEVVLDSIARYCSNLPGAVEAVEVLGPPDIEEKTGLAGGHIFQGEILPSNMWDQRLSARTPMPGLYLCGAGTHPGGSIIGINGRNAAMEILRDKGFKQPFS